MEEPALYVRDGDAFVGTVLTQGGWSPSEANGAAVLALFGQLLDEVPTLAPMTLSRLTADLMRPVPIGEPMRVTTAVLREGRKIQLVELRLLVGDVVHVRATALRLRDAELEGSPPVSTSDDRPADRLVPPDEALSFRELSPHGPGFLRALDLRQAPTVDGSGVGAWARLDAAVVAGEPTSPTARLVFAFDCSNLIGYEQHAGDWTMINPDVTGHVLRRPVDDWVAITGDTRFDAGLGRGVSSARLSDSRGVFAVVSLSQLVQPR